MTVKKNIVIFDLDGTLSLLDHRRHLVENGNNKWDEFYQACDKDEPNIPVIKMCNILYETHDIYIFSGRSAIVRDKTKEWLTLYDVKYHALIMRECEDFRSDEIIKKEMLRNCVFDQEKISWIFDDRNKVVKMWRKEGLPCFQVADGNF